MINPARRRYNALKHLCKKSGWAPLAVSQDEFVIWFERHDIGACECCGAPLAGKQRKVVDHDHATGVLRGVLCQHCNFAEGLLKTNQRWVAIGQYMGWV